MVVCTELPVGTSYTLTSTPSPPEALASERVVTVGGPPASAVAVNATQLLGLPLVGQVVAVVCPGARNAVPPVGHGAMPTRAYCQVLVPELSSATKYAASVVLLAVWFGMLISACANRKVRPLAT